MKHIICLFISALLMSGGTALAQTRVAVVPMATSSKIAKNIYGGGFIEANGTLSRSFGGSFTVTHSGTGLYTILMPGFWPGCSADKTFPNVMANLAFNTGHIYAAPSFGDCATGNTYSLVATSNAAGTATDLAFQILIMLNDVSPAPAGAQTNSVSNPAYCQIDQKTGMIHCK